MPRTKILYVPVEGVAILLLEDKYDVDARFASSQGAFRTLEIEEMGIEKFDFIEVQRAINFFFILSAGKAEAASYLAECFERDIGVKVNQETKEFLEELTLVIGRNLGDEESVNGLADDVISPETLQCGASCASLIKHNQKEIAQLIASHKFLTLKDVIGYAKELDHLVQSISHHSYLNSMADGPDPLDATYKNLLPHVELLDAEGNVVMMGEVPVPEGCCTIM